MLNLRFVAKVLLLVVFLIGYILITTSDILAQDNKVRFEHLTQEQGLSSNAIRCVLQDHKGFLWIGTEFGLNRYDGRIKTYQYPKNFPARTIIALYEDKEDTLWLGTSDNGLLKYDRENDLFTKVNLQSTKSEKKLSISSIYADKKSFLWLTTDLGLIKIDPKTQQDSLCISKNNSEVEAISAVIEDKEGKFWAFSNSKAYLFDRDTNQILDSVTLEGSLLNVQASPKSLVLNTDGNILIGTIKGLYEFNTKNRQMSVYAGVSTGQISSMFLSRENVLWIGTVDLGLIRLNLTTKDIIYYKSDPKDPNSLSSNAIFVVYEDISKVLWIGDRSYGINTLSPYKNLFRLYRNNPFDENTIVNDYIRGICEDSDGSIWVASQLSGISNIDSKREKIVCYKNDPKDPKSLPKGQIWDIYKDGKGTLWISIFPLAGSLENPVEPAHTKLTPFILGNSVAKITYFTNVIYQDSKGRMWFGNETGLYVLSKDGKSLEPYNNDDFTLKIDQAVQSIYEDSNGNIWIGLSDSFLRFNPTNNSYVKYGSEIFSIGTSDIYVCSFLETKNKKLWIATKGNGIFCFDLNTNTFTNITEKDGLTHNNTYGILEDSQRTLWISTDNGISHYNPQTKEFENFGVADGLQGKEFNRRAFFKSSNGEMFFGGPNGLNSFYPEKIKKNTIAPKVIISEFLAVGVPISLEAKTNISLDYTQKSLVFKVAVIDFNAPESNLYSYKLEGFDKDWVSTRGQKDIIYTNLDPGTYTFKVKGTNNHQLWSLNVAEIKIVIYPPPWRNNLAYFLYFLIFVGGIFLTFRYQANKIKIKVSIKENELKAEAAMLEAKALEREAQIAKIQKETMEREAEVARLQAEVLEKENLQRIENENQVRQRNLELQEANLKLKEVNEMKANFVAMLVHDLKAPLTAVDLTLETLLEKEDKSNLEIINMISDSEQSVRKIVSLVNEMLEFYQTDSQEMKFDFSPTNLLEILRYCLQIAKISAMQKKLTLDFQVKDPLPIISADSSKLERVFSNLLSNAIKFTPTNGQILVKVWVEEGSGVEAGLRLIHISITDTGEGIALEELPYIFEPYHQARSSNKSSGVGLGLAIVKRIVAAHSGNISVQSQPSVGTCFTVMLPILSVDANIEEDPSREIFTEIKEVITPHPELNELEQISVNSKKILIAEDDEISQTLLAKKLKKLGYSVEVVNNGADAIKLCLENQYDLILMDYYMPEKDGLEAAKEIRSRENPNKYTPIITITGKAQNTIEKESKQAGINDFIEKPFNFKTIEQVIQQWLTANKNA